MTFTGLRRLLARLACVGLVGAALTELGSCAALRWLATHHRPDPRLALAQYRDRAWAARYWGENQAVTALFEYHPFVQMRRAPFRGETITIGDGGTRATRHSHCDLDVPAVFMFGGSTLWGYGAPDWLTIPSLLAQRFEEAGSPLCVVNFGDVGRVSTLEVVELIQALKRKARQPDLVAFYDGCNDVLAAWLHGQAAVESEPGFYARVLRDRQRAASGSLAFLELTSTRMIAERIAQRLG